MSKKSILAACLVIVAELVCAQSNLGNSKNDSTKVLDTLYLNVTASKVELSDRETAKPVTVIDRVTIEQNAGRELSQILMEQAGFAIAGANSSPSQNVDVYLRGASSAHTLVLIDGIPANDPSSSIGAAIDWRLIPLQNIERIEILKGSQSTLYGTNAIAGVINIITKKENSNKLKIQGSGSYGSFNTSKANLAISQKYKKIAYNVGVNSTLSNGISSAYNLKDTSKFDHDAFRNHSIKANFTYQIDSNLSISPSLLASKLYAEYDDDAFIDGDNYYNTSLLSPSFQADYKKKNVQMRALYNYINSNNKGQGAWGGYEYKGRAQNADFFATYHIDDKMQILCGLQFQNENLLDTTIAEVNRHAYAYSPYATFLLKDYKGFGLEAGFRYNIHTVFGTNSVFSFAPYYFVTNRVKIFSSYATGYKAPTVTQLYNVAWGGNKDLKPEKSTSAELGVEYKVKSNFIRITAYDRLITDLISYVNWKNINLNKQHVQGVELDGKCQINNKLSVRGQYTFTYGYSINEEKKKDSIDYNLVRRPKHIGVLALEYKPCKGCLIGLSGQFIGKRSDYFFDPNTWVRSTVSLDSYVLCNLYAEYRLNKYLVIFGEGKNLLNAQYYEVYGYGTQSINGTLGLRFQIQ